MDALTLWGFQWGWWVSLWGPLLDNPRTWDWRKKLPSLGVGLGLETGVLEEI